MPSNAEENWLCVRAGKAKPRVALTCAVLMIIGLSSCDVDIKDGVFICSTRTDCPTGLQCHPQTKRCTRQPFGTSETDLTGKPDSGASVRSERRAADAGRPDADADAAMRRSASASGDHADAGSPRAMDMDTPRGPSAADQRGASPSSKDAANGGSDSSQPTAGSGGDPNAASGTGGAVAEAGSSAPLDPQSMSADCPRDTYCYGFESGALDPSGALWPSPSDGSGGLPSHDELTTAPYPASSRNLMLVSRPSSKDGWPKATVGFSGPRTAFSELIVSFDYAAGDKLNAPNPRVILFRFVGAPARSGDSVNVGVLDNDVMLEVQTDGPDPLSAIGPAPATGVLSHVVASFARSPGSCLVTVAYGELPPKAAAFPCDVENWQIEIGLDLLETPPEKYNDEYVGYFDNLRVSNTP
jgi:hypothetical protein